MSDDVAERVARALIDVDPCIKGYHETHIQLKMRDVNAALAALQPGDEVGEGLYVEQIYSGSFLENHPDPVRQAAEATREACAAHCEKFTTYSTIAAARGIRALDLDKILEG